jgi:AraC-like DNA-binding protein
VSLQELADLVNLNPFYLSRVFRKQVGVPPHVYHTHLRVAEAKRLLAAGVRLSQVAHATGFYDQSHFGQHFKRLVGVPPGAYAQHVRSKTS